MATLMIEYDMRNRTARQVIKGLVSSGVFRIRDDAEKEKKAIRTNIREAKQMIEDIRTNGSANYQNMDQFLVSLKK
jgi:predicted transcriptional regulator